MSSKLSQIWPSPSPPAAALNTAAPVACPPLHRSRHRRPMPASSTSSAPSSPATARFQAPCQLRRNLGPGADRRSRRAGIPTRPATGSITKDLGWYYDDSTEWGRIVHHYGRWAHDTALGWVWVGGEEFSPGWVVWRTSETMGRLGADAARAGHQDDLGRPVQQRQALDLHGRQEVRLRARAAPASPQRLAVSRDPRARRRLVTEIQLRPRHRHLRAAAPADHQHRRHRHRHLPSRGRRASSAPGSGTGTGS